jgi:hypothetical protein
MTVELWSSLTPAEQVALLEGHHVTYDAGCDLLDSDDVFVDDISADLVAAGSSVGRGIYRTLHGSCRLNLSIELSWGSARLRPYMLVSSDGATWFRQNLGVFLPSTPERQIGEVPPIWSVECFDKLDILAGTPHGSTFTLAAGAAIIPAVEALITGAGEAKVGIDQSAVAEVAPGEVVLPLSDGLTTLQICNELLDGVGYRALRVDREGWYRSIPYVSPVNLPLVWTYNADSASTTVSESRTSISDYYQAANEIVGINDDPANDIPTDGDGLYTLSNQSDGLTSIDGRGGRTIRRIVRGTYASQEALETAVQRVLDAESRVARLFELSVSPNPVHGHFDVVRFVDSAVPVDGRMLVTDWEMPLDGSDMRLSLRGV